MIFSRRVRVIVFIAASLAAFGSSGVVASAQPGTDSAAPFASASALPIVGDPRDARARNLEMLDAVVFILGVGVLGGVLVWWGLRIYREK